MSLDEHSGHLNVFDDENTKSVLPSALKNMAVA